MCIRDRMKAAVIVPLVSRATGAARVARADGDRGPSGTVCLDRRLTRDVVGHNAGEKAPTFDADETDSLEQLGQLTWRIEVPYHIREVANTLHAFGRTPKKLCRKPYRETQIGQVWHFDDPRCRAKHIIMAEDAARLENPTDLLERSNDLEMARSEL